MTISLDALLGKCVTDIYLIHDYLHIKFEDESIINIFNKFGIAGDAITDVARFKGCRIVSLGVFGNIFRLSMDNGRAIEVGLRDEDYSGPEVLEIVTKQGERLVWQ